MPLAQSVEKSIEVRMRTVEPVPVFIGIRYMWRVGLNTNMYPANGTLSEVRFIYNGLKTPAVCGITKWIGPAALYSVK